MGKEKLNQKLDQIKKDNVENNQRILQLERAKQELIRQSLVNEGRILILNDLLDEMSKEEKE